MRIACVVAAAVFGLFAYWQLNDFEQYGTRLFHAWFVAYSAVAAVSLASIWRLLPQRLVVSGGIAALLAAAVRASAIPWGEAILYNETNPAGNETGGLLITAIWLMLLAWRRSR